MALLRLENVQKNYILGGETIRVLKDVNLEVDRGETLTITGESGCGKSTLLNLIGGIDSPSGGNIIIDGHNITGLDEDDLSEYRSSVIGFIFQFHFLLKDFDALENIMMPAIIRGEDRKQARQRALTLINDVGMAHRKEHFLVNLSGGERQRVAVARSLMNDPSLIIADEPTGNLDEKNTRIVEDILFELVEKYNKTLLLVTHDGELARRGDRHYTIEHGNLKLYED